MQIERIRSVGYNVTPDNQLIRRIQGNSAISSGGYSTALMSNALQNPQAFTNKYFEFMTEAVAKFNGAQAEPGVNNANLTNHTFRAANAAVLLADKMGYTGNLNELKAWLIEKSIELVTDIIVGKGALNDALNKLHSVKMA